MGTAVRAGWNERERRCGGRWPAGALGQMNNQMHALPPNRASAQHPLACDGMVGLGQRGRGCIWVQAPLLGQGQQALPRALLRSGRWRRAGTGITPGKLSGGRRHAIGELAAPTGNRCSLPAAQPSAARWGLPLGTAKRAPHK